MRNFIKEIKLYGSKPLRDQISFSDPDKIRIYDDRAYPGIRLKGVYNQWSEKIEFPLDTDITVRLPVWNPQAVKEWKAFEALTTIPDGTSIAWRVSDDENDFWWDGAQWATPGATDWNTEAEICNNLPTFSIVNKKIQLIAKLTTTDLHETPLLIGYRFLIDVDYDPWEDLIRSVMQGLKAVLNYSKFFIGKMQTTAASLNVKTDAPFVPEEPNINITDINAVYNYDIDPQKTNNIFDTFNATTGEITLTTSIDAGVTLWLEYVVSPDVKINYTSTDYIEISKIPAVVIDSMDSNSSQTKSSMELIDKGQLKAYRLKDAVLIRELSINGFLLTGSTSDQMHLHSALWAGMWGQPLLSSIALDVDFTIELVSPLRWSPTPNLNELRQTIFEVVITNYHLWLSDLEVLPIVQDFKYTFSQQGIDQPIAEKIQPLSAGVIPGL